MKRASWPHFLTGLLAFCALSSRDAHSASPVGTTTQGMVIQSVEVAGHNVALRQGTVVNLGSSPGDILFHFYANTNATRPPLRLRYRLEGYENNWHSGDGEVYLGVRFFNDAGDQVDQVAYKMRGESAGWNGSLTDSTLTHRRETMIVPPQASRVMVVISSAGPPSTEGVYVMANLMITKTSGSSPPEVIIQSPFEGHASDDFSSQAPRGWMRDGNHASMAKIVDIGKDMATKALAILDDDPFSHAEWHTTLDLAPHVKPGDSLVVEWNEMYSTGVSDVTMAHYGSLPFGNYQFQVEEVNIFGLPTGASASINVRVPPPFWRMPWFWGAVFVGTIAAIFGGWRYLAWYHLRREMLALKSQQALERERLRIAHDIHDDLGARVTQISLLSAMSVDNGAFPEKARAEFDRISRMSRELVSALYETVWAVNPENDNLDALGNYLCQMVNQLCERSQFRCRFHMNDLPHEIELSSQTRHNISMAVKEAVHNVIKHAKATEVVIRMNLDGDLLTISVQDDGRGFDPTQNGGGNGLNNMKRRLEDIGGSSSIESQPGTGTAVHFRLTVKIPMNA